VKKHSVTKKGDAYSTGREWRMNGCRASLQQTHSQVLQGSRESLEGLINPRSHWKLADWRKEPSLKSKQKVDFYSNLTLKLCKIKQCVFSLHIVTMFMSL